MLLLKKLPEDAIKDCKIVPRPGKKIHSLCKELREGQIDIDGYEVIGLLIGTNDISDWVVCEHGLVGYRTKLKWCHVPRKTVTWDMVLANFGRLMETIRQLNSSATIVMSSIIPTPGDWEWSKEACIELSDHIQRWCCEQQESDIPCIFTPTHKFFMKNGKPVMEYFGWDGVHLSESGLGRVRQSLQQALSDKNQTAKGKWRRRPEGRGVGPTEIKRLRKGKVSGNRIVF